SLLTQPNAHRVRPSLDTLLVRADQVTFNCVLITPCYEDSGTGEAIDDETSDDAFPSVLKPQAIGIAGARTIQDNDFRRCRADYRRGVCDCRQRRCRRDCKYHV